PDAPVGYASGVKDFRPFLSVALVLIALSAALLIGPAFAASLVLAMPDRRGIPQLVTRERDVIRYGTGFVVSPDTVLTAKHAVAGAVEIIFPTGSVTGHVQCGAPGRDTAVVAARLPKRLDDQPVLHEDRDQHTIPFAVVADIGRRRDIADDDLDAVAFQLEDGRRAPRGDEQRASRPHRHTVQVTRGERPDFPLCAAWTEGVHFPGLAERHHDQSAIGQDGDAVGRVEVGALHHHREFSGQIDLLDRIGAGWGG